MRLLVLLIVACDAGKAPAPPAPVPVVVRDAAPADAVKPPDAAVVIDAGGELSAEDLAFEKAVLAYTKVHDRFLAGWGTVRLDGVHPNRFATLMNYDERNDSRGAYLIELAPDRYIQVLFAVDGRTQAFEHGDGVRRAPSEIAWTRSEALRIDHEAGHHHGGEGFAFGLHAGKLVLFDYDYIDDTTDVRTKAEEHFADASGVCVRGCPPLAKHVYRDSRLSVSEVAPSIAALVDPPLPAYPIEP